ncbi:SURF1 family protein [Pseudohaliea rubra]|uniref:SURF1-like protein n=1 Tax=Pseudohaliea rubra DSM 19751 TaxID=1265313 RepID=A0A095VUS1_9GAMM|nr:SURF1 family protein [Pseudohaliea rubra]KGE04828.1 Cytochrome oxidase biogenesis protein Surf1, facilitates heme A insertion [Pseudohaliea rubra DSM 19751]
MQASFGALELDLEWRTTVLVLLLLPVLVTLGFWQLDREREKRELLARFEARQAAAPARLGQALAAREPAALAYLPVRLQGRYVAGRYLLLDNRIQGGRFGYEVVSLFARDDGAYTLVNRGWVPGDPARRSLPQPAAPAGRVELTGQLYVPPDPPYLLGEQSQAVDDWPRVVQALEMAPLTAALAAELGAAVFPWSVRLDATAPGALAAAWPVVNVSPAKHRGYAVQWFTMAAVLGLFFVLRSSNLWALLRGGPKATGRKDD